MSNRLKIKCPSCERPLVVPSTAVGRKGKCPTCNHVFKIELEDESFSQPLPPPPPTPSGRTGGVKGQFSGDPELDQQPAHREEITQDKRRMASAISMVPDKYAVIEPYLMDYEQPVAIAVQRQFPFSIFSDVVLLTSHRLLMFKRFFTKIDMFDVNYVDVRDVRVRQGFFTSALTVSAGNSRTCTIQKLITDQALNVYRMCQDIETKARIARRQFQLEENRSRTTQMQINNLMAGQGAALPTNRPPVPFVRPEDISIVGEEVSDPYRLGE